jgi:hypothetical protein
MCIIFLLKLNFLFSFFFYRSDNTGQFSLCLTYIFILFYYLLGYDI